MRLRSTDPLDTPLINFHYFNELTCPGEGDQTIRISLALVDGVKFVRGIAKQARTGSTRVTSEEHPGRERRRPAGRRRSEIKDWIRREAWGHHACGTCRMGP